MTALLETPVPNLCTAIEPVTRWLICQREADHPMPHRCVWHDEDGTHTAEWYDLSLIRKMIHPEGETA